RSFLRFGYGVSFEALEKGAIEILGPYGISYTFRRLAKRISQLQSGFVVRRVRYDPWPPAWWGAAPPLWINGKPDSTNPRKGCTAVASLYHPSHSIPSSRIVLYRIRPDRSIERMKSDFNKSSRTDYSRRILGEAVSGDSPAESRMRGDLHVRWCGEMGHSCASRAVVIGRGAERTQESSASELPLGNRTTTSNEINWFHAA
ncbi:hypothetical protein HID58_042898, partial [Brassica napus]